MMERQAVMQVQDPVLRGYMDQLEPLRLDAYELLDGLTAEQVNWRPPTARWSIGQCVEHVTLTLRLYPESIDRAIAEARARSAAGARPYREGFFSGWFVRSMEPPPKIRVRTLRTVDPPGDLDGDVVLATFVAELARFGQLMVAADGVPLQHGRAQSPFSKLFSFTLSQTFELNLAHARRHLWQARQVRQEAGFPAGVSDLS